MIFAAILMGVTFLTGAVWLIDKLFLRKGKLKKLYEKRPPVL